jgi:hypothetical protein
MKKAVMKEPFPILRMDRTLSPNATADHDNKNAWIAGFVLVAACVLVLQQIFAEAGRTARANRGTVPSTEKRNSG